jgi:hypothetical protein
MSGRKPAHLRTTGTVLAELLGAEIGPPYDCGRPRPRAGTLLAAWRRFGAAIAKGPGLVVLPVLMAADDLTTAPAATTNGSAAVVAAQDGAA